MGQQQADALGLLAETALHHRIDPGAPGERYQVVVHVEAGVLADADSPGQSVLEGGMRVSAETSQRLACDTTRVVMRHDADGRVTEVGARTRTIPPALRRALQHRDRGCRFPGCGRSFGQGHHIRHWANGGPTTLSNLTLLTRRRGALLPAPRRRAPAGKPGGACDPCQSRRDATRWARGAGACDSRADGDAGLAGRAPGRRICDRRLASARRVSPCRIRQTRQQLTARAAVALATASETPPP